MDLEQIQSVISLMKANDLVSFSIQEADFRLSLERARPVPPPPPPFPPAAWPAPVFSAPAAPAPVAAPSAPAAAPAAAAAPAERDPALQEIRSPLVGTFYRAPKPDAAPFVSVGDAIAASTVVGVVEAMKVMNEITAGIAGTVEKILVDNASPVQFDQPLFLVRKA
jgi:acetyl-CoA carboxylase biotin carboxyl carrier protein